MKLLLGEMADYLFTSLRVAPRAAEQAGFHFEYPNIEAALESAVRGKHAQLLAERSTGRH
jgi:NAD dependent epimerase/dehydratase family enzyme